MLSDSKPGTDPLVIRSLEFLGPMATVDGWRPQNDLPDVAFAGRSNVGKSSLLNRLIHRKKFARVSNTPGRTREINFFKVNDAFVFVDLPGYGYARISKERRAEWKPLIEGYLRASTNLRGIVHLLDYPVSYDRDLFRFADYNAGRYASRPPCCCSTMRRARARPMPHPPGLVETPGSNSCARTSRGTPGPSS